MLEKNDSRKRQQPAEWNRGCLTVRRYRPLPPPRPQKRYDHLTNRGLHNRSEVSKVITFAQTEVLHSSILSWRILISVGIALICKVGPEVSRRTSDDLD